LIQIVFDEVIKTVFPLILYGTKDIDLMPDLIIKRVGVTFFIALFSAGPLDAWTS
jgi:hypothetical protein